MSTTKTSHTQIRVGRPRLGDYRLETMLPIQVLNELVRVETESGVYRTRVAANVLLDWAKNNATARVVHFNSL
jgi:hypothetical protein